MKTNLNIEVEQDLLLAAEQYAQQQELSIAQLIESLQFARGLRRWRCAMALWRDPGICSSKEKAVSNRDGLFVSYKSS